jgi:integrase
MSRAVDVTADDIDHFKRERRGAGRAPATINRGLEVLRQAYRLAVKKKRLAVGQVPEIEFLAVDNVRSGFFDLAEMTALLPRIPDTDVRDFVEWGYRTGQRKSEIAVLTWVMLDRSGDVWVLRLPGSITKNKRGRVLGLSADTRAIIERRVKVRRLDCPLIFHRVSKGRAGQPVKGIDKLWRNALKAAGLPLGRLFHDLRRSAVRTLIRSGVDPSVAMKVSGHKTRSMLDRYNIIDEAETAAALEKADAYLSTQPTERNLEHTQNAHNPAPRRNAQ